MISWGAQPHQAKLYLIPVGAHVAPPGLMSVGGSFCGYLGARIIIQDFGKRIVDTVISVDELSSIEKCLPENLANQLRVHVANINAPRTAMSLNGLDRTILFDKPLVMGVLNVTPDSFSDGGKFTDVGQAVEHALAMHNAGANIIDIGGESTRPGATSVWEGDELKRVLPVIQALQKYKIPLSLDSRHASVLKKGLEAGAHIINDVSALTYDEESIKVAAHSMAPVILMHAQGDPQTMQKNPTYQDVVLDVFDYLQDRVQACVAAGIEKNRIIVDPGIGFGKRVVQDNLSLINNLSIFHTLGCPLLLGVSRKRFIGAITNIEVAQERVAGSLAAGYAALLQGVHILRVHDVDETVQAVQVFQSLNDAAMMDTLS